MANRCSKAEGWDSGGSCECEVVSCGSGGGQWVQVFILAGNNKAPNQDPDD